MPTPSSPATTRERVLQAGLDLWIETPPAELFAGLNVSRLAKAAGITRATFYAYWSTTQEYLDELVDHITDPTTDGYEPDVVDLMNQMALGDGDLHAQYEQACQMQLLSVVDDPGLRVRLGMLAKLDDPVVAEKLRRQYRITEQRAVAASELMLTRWGREARPPVTMEQLAALYSTFMDAFAARHLIDPEGAPVEVYSWAAFALLITLTRMQDDGADLPVVAGLMSRFPSDGERVRRSRTNQQGEITAFARSQGRVITPFDIAATARGLLTERPWQELSVEEVAAAADISAGEIRRLFGSKHALGIGVFLMLADESFAAIPDGLDPITELRTMIALATELMERSKPLTQSAILVFAGMSESYAPGAITWGPIPRIVTLVGAAQRAGQLRPDLDTEDFAMAMLRTLLTHAQPTVRTGDLNPVNPTELMLLGAGAPPADGQVPAVPLRTVS